MIDIKIIKIITTIDLIENTSRTATFTIQENGGAIYWYARGGLPLSGDIQVMLDAEAEDLYDAAEAKGQLATDREIYLAEGRQWFIDHPNAKDLFNLPMAEIDTLIAAWDLSAIPNPGRNELKMSIRALMCSVRILAAEVGLID